VHCYSLIWWKAFSKAYLSPGFCCVLSFEILINDVYCLWTQIQHQFGWPYQPENASVITTERTNSSKTFLQSIQQWCVYCGFFLFQPSDEVDRLDASPSSGLTSYLLYHFHLSILLKEHLRSGSNAET
jgi:hypothetical protein